MTIFGSAVTVRADATAADWIAPRLGEFGTIGGLVPNGYDCVVVHPDLSDPDKANAVALARAIAGLARRHTPTPDRVWFAVWEGYGWATSRTFVVAPGHGLRRRLLRRWFRWRCHVADRWRSRRVMRGLALVPSFELPYRGYHLMRGPLDAIGRITEPGGTRALAPDLWWPEDRRWFVATDTDLDWICVGGDAAFVADIVAAFRGRTSAVSRDVRNADVPVP